MSKKKMEKKNILELKTSSRAPPIVFSPFPAHPSSTFSKPMVIHQVVGHADVGGYASRC